MQALASSGFAAGCLRYQEYSHLYILHKLLDLPKREKMMDAGPQALPNLDSRNETAIYLSTATLLPPQELHITRVCCLPASVSLDLSCIVSLNSTNDTLWRQHKGFGAMANSALHSHACLRQL